MTEEPLTAAAEPGPEGPPAQPEAPAPGCGTCGDSRVTDSGSGDPAPCPSCAAPTPAAVTAPARVPYPTVSGVLADRPDLSYLFAEPLEPDWAALYSTGLSPLPQRRPAGRHAMARA